MNFSRSIIAGVLLGIASLSANAGLVCTAATAAKVSNTAGCELGSTNNDFLNPLQVNTDLMFGFDDWVFAEKEFDADQDIDIGLSGTGLQMGTWTIDDIWGAYTDVMLVFKSGAGNVNIDTYVGYLLTDGATTGDYMTPHANANNGKGKDISHISAYVRRGGNNVKIFEPGALTLLGLSLMGGVAFARRIRSSSRAI